MVNSTEITKAYFFGDQNITDYNQVNYVSTPTVSVNKQQFMLTGAGRFAVGAQFELVQEFFDTGNTIAQGTYTKMQMASLFGISDYGWNMQQINYRDSTPDYAERVYIYNSMAFQITNSAQFVVDSSGNRTINYFGTEPRQDVTENFDFESSSWLATIGNYPLEAYIDPFNSGYTVEIGFSGGVVTRTYDSSDFSADQSLIATWSGLDASDLLSGIESIVLSLDASHLTRILNGTNNSDTITYNGAPVLAGTTVNIVSGQGNDSITVNNSLPNDIWVYGGDGNDTIVVTENAEEPLFFSIVYAGSGDDFIKSQGNNGLHGDGGDDTVSYQDASSSISLDFYNKTINVNGKIDTIFEIENATGSAFNDIFISDQAHHKIEGSAGLDTVDYSQITGSDFVNVNLATGKTYLNLIKDDTPSVAEKDTISSIENIKGTKNADVLVGSSGANSLYGQHGNDYLEGGGGADKLFGGSGSDTLNGGSDTDWISYADSTQIVEDTVNGGESVSGYGVVVNITSQDTVNGGFSGTVNESIGGSSQIGIDEFTSIEGFILTDADDSVEVASADVTTGFSVEFGMGTDVLIITGSTLTGAQFADVTGLDRIYFESDHSHQLEIFNDVVDASDNDLLEIDFSGAITSTNNSTLDATAVTSGAVSVLGGAGADVLETGAGADTLAGGHGQDTLDGGSGIDWISYADSTTIVEDTMSGGESVSGYGVVVNITSQDTVNASFSGTVDETIGGTIYDASTDTFTGIEGIELTDAHDKIYLDQMIVESQVLSISQGRGWDSLYGTDNAETIDGANFVITQGEEAVFRVYGEDGDDSIGGFNVAINAYGGTGEDTIEGGDLDDTLDGGHNDNTSDTLKGGDGTDLYIFDDSGGLDTIVDSDNWGTLQHFETQSIISGFGAQFNGFESRADQWAMAWNIAPGNASYTVAILTWDGDPSVENSSGELRIDFENSGYDDIIIENFTNGAFGIELEDALPGFGGGGGPSLSAPTLDGHDYSGIHHTAGGGEFDAYVYVGGSYTQSTSLGYTISSSVTPGSSSGGGHRLHGVFPFVYGDGDPLNFGFLNKGTAGGTFKPKPAGMVGDPHVATYDGLYYDFQDAGEFTMVQSTDSNDFTVQARLKTWDLGDSTGDKFSVNTAIATEIDGTRVGVYIPGEITYDNTLYGLDDDPETSWIPSLYIEDQAYLLPDNGLLFVEDGYVYRSGNTYTIINAYGDGVVAEVHDNYINATSFLSSFRASGTVEGLLGNYDGDTSNDIALDDGTVLGTSLSADMLYDTFGEDWRISQGESLFLYNSGETTSTWNYAGFDNSYLTLDDFDSGDVATATATAIANGFDENSDIFNSIVMDILVMGDLDFSETWEILESESFEIADISDDVSSNVIMGTSSGDYIVGTADEDHIIALAGNDTIYGRQEADTILGGTGNDSLYGEGGGDTYIHSKGDGDDYILSVAGDLSKVVMGGVSEDKLYLNVSGYHLYATDVDTGEQLQLVNQYYGIGSGFKIGTVNGINVATALHVKGSSATAGEIIYATIGSGDTLEGGLGNDTLYGNGGTDIFLHNIGDGNDVLNSTNAALSTVTMVDVDAEDIRLEVSSNNVLAINKNNGETLTLAQQLYGVAYGYKFDNVNGINLIGGLELEGDDTAEAILGTVNADTITGSEGNDTITGGGGADVFVHEVGDGNDTLIVNSGDLATLAVYGVATSDLRLNVSGYNLLISNVVNSEVITLQNQFHNLAYGYKFASVNGIDLTTGLTIEGGSSADTLNGTDQADSILGGAGADTIHGGLGDDTLIGGLDNDSVYGDGGTDMFLHDSGDGSDLLYENPDAEAIVIMNGVSNSNIYFTTNGYNLYATDVTNGEQLTLYNQYHNLPYGYKFGTLNGMDITGGLVIKGTSATAGEHIKGTTGADTLEGGFGNDTIEGRDGDDIFIHSVGDGNDVLYSWNDAEATITMNGVSTGDILINVSGNNVIITDDATGETLTLINQNYQTNYGYKFASVNGINLMGGLEITGDDSNNLLYGTANADTITGGEGNDTLYGNGGADSFVHEIGDGNDVLYTNYANLATVTFVGVSSDDLLFSANGYHLIVTDTNTGETIQLTNQYHNIGSGYKFSSVNGVAVNGGLVTDGTDNADSITGSYYADSIGGGLGADTLKGNSGNDTLYGGDGNDSLSGESNDDVLYGNDGNDTLNGGAHNDTLEGGAGDDSLTGSSQNDTFVFIGSNTGDDTITDFNGTYDLLQFDSGIFATAAAAVAAFSSGVIDLGGGNSVTLTGISTLVEADVEII